MVQRNAEAEWRGGLQDGAGTMKLGSGAYEGAYSFKSRFAEGTGTNPEELIGAAHAGCFSMAFSAGLGKAGFTPTRVHTTAKVTFEKTDAGFAVTRIDLETEGEVPGIDEAAFQQQAENAKRDCPISRLLAPGTQITLKARLILILVTSASDEHPVHPANPKPIRFTPESKGPLSGIRVLDLSRLVAGNMLSLQLGDFGADVIKIEPLDGDPLRAWREGGEQLFWKTYSRNKMSVALDLRHDAAKDALLRLVETADVFIENYRPGTLEKMGLAPEVLMARNPRLIVVRISGFGQTGPYAQLPGFGTLVEAMSGLAARTGFADREPVLPPLALADMIAGLSGAMAVVTALFARDRGQGPGQGRGQVIDLSLLEPIFSTLGPEAAIYQRTGVVKERAGNGTSISSPRNIYACSDGKYVALSGSTQAMARRVFEVIGRPDMIHDPRFATNSDRVRNRVAVDAAVGAWFAARTRDEALAHMRNAGVSVGPVYNIDDAVADEHFRARQILVDVEDPELGALPMHNIVPRLSGTPGVWRRPAPSIGQHTDELLREAGLDGDQIAQLRKEGGCA